VVNGLGAVCVLISLSMSFHLGALLVQVFYILTSACAIATRLRPRSRPHPRPSQA
jgi:hypothetical protein